MTDNDLQDAIIKELESMKIRIPNGKGWKSVSIFKQNKPFRHDEADEELDNYILVVLGDEKTDKDGRWNVEVQMLFQVMTFDEGQDGEQILTNLMNEIDLHFTKKGILKKRYEMDPYDKAKARNPLCDPNYAQSAYVTKWKLPNVPVEMEVGNLT